MKKWVAVSALVAILLIPAAQASGDHAHRHNKVSSQADNYDYGGYDLIDGHELHDMGMSGEGMFLKKKQVGKYTVNFHVMAKKDKGHELMVKVEEAGYVLNNIQSEFQSCWS